MGNETKIQIRPRSGHSLHGYEPPDAEQETEEIGDDVIARLNPETDAIEHLEVLFFSTRLLRHDLFELPVSADLRLVHAGSSPSAA